MAEINRFFLTINCVQSYASFSSSFNEVHYLHSGVCRHQADPLSSPGWQEHQCRGSQDWPGPGVPGIRRNPLDLPTHTYHQPVLHPFI